MSLGAGGGGGEQSVAMSGDGKFCFVRLSLILDAMINNFIFLGIPSDMGT